MIHKIKRILGLKLTAADHNALGHKLVSHWGQKEKDYNWGDVGKVSSKYKIVEICKGDLAGHCWIERVK